MTTVCLYKGYLKYSDLDMKIKWQEKAHHATMNQNKTGVAYSAQMVKNLPVIQDTQVQSLGQEDPPEKEMATHSIVLAWRAPQTEEPGGLQPMRSQESDMTQ